MVLNIRSLLLHVLVYSCVCFTVSSVALAAPKSEDDAVVLVGRWLAQTPNPLESKMAVVINNVETFKDDDGVPLYHIVHIKPRGFVIVSADDLIEPIIGFFPNAEKFSPRSMNPLAALLMRDIPGRMKTVRSNLKNAIPGGARSFRLPKRQQQAKKKWGKFLARIPSSHLKMNALPDADIDDIRVSPLIASRWSQSTEAGAYCYNYYTPKHYVTGCVATAMAQLMRYYQYPQTGVGTTQFGISVDGVAKKANLRGGNGAGGAYDWSNMMLDPDFSITDIKRKAIGALLYDAGVSVNMAYKPGGSSASVLNASRRLKSAFKYGSSVFGANYHDGWHNLTDSMVEKMINSNLDGGYPVILGISGDGGHAILADGYGINNATLYHHLNMGWAGYDDGWYNMPDIHTTQYNFNTVDEVVYNVFPQGSGEVVSGRVVDSGGNPVQGATVTATGGGKTHNDITDDNGIFAFGKVSSNTTFIITTSKSGYAMSPSQRSVTTATSQGGFSTWSVSGNVWAVNFTGTADLKGDIDRSGQVTLVDAILALQIMGGGMPGITVTINSNIDVNGDQSIGLAEAVYALKQEGLH